jgi:S-layer protein (TIGR01564 family)
VAGGKYKEILPVRTPIATLASKADKTKNLILVGGPCANTLVQELVDTGKLNADYTCAGRVLGSAWTPNTAYIIVTDGFTTGKYAVVVAGTAADDTVLASNALQQYDASPVKEAIANKSAVKIVGTAIATATITAA